MRSSIHTLLGSAALAAAIAGSAAAQTEVLVTADITTSTTWTANNTYNLQRQIYVRPGATLTIEAGTVIASTTGLGGSLAVTRGAQIFVQGTDERPVIFTSKADVQTWVNGNPKTGTWRESANEWGNLTIMGRAYIAENAVAGNTPVPSASNVAVMEGLVAGFPGDTRVLYGGGDDNDDSGSISHMSLRYTGRVVSLNNELNGLSLGGIGRETDIHHVEIMNNVDDGIEIWGGTVNLKYFSIWNIGDDSFDVDQGWRGKAQFGLVVQGYSLDAPSGSGVCDNGFEMDGAEDSDWQPVTTAVIANVTFVGQPVDGDHATAWRDNARVQFHNCVFMDTGKRVVQLDNVDGDGGSGYGHNGTKTWAEHWTTPYTQYSTVNAPANPAAFYTAQSSGNWIQFRETIFYNNAFGTAYTEADARGVFGAGNGNLREPSVMPVAALTRGPSVVKGGRVMRPVTFLDPRPAGDARFAGSAMPQNGFFSPVRVRGGFRNGVNWLGGWTASEAFGFTPRDRWADLGQGLGGVTGEPVMFGTGNLANGQPVSLGLTKAAANAPCAILVSVSRADLPILGGILVPNLLTGASVGFATGAGGGYTLNLPGGMPGPNTFYLQTVVLDAAAPQNLSFSNAVKATVL